MQAAVDGAKYSFHSMQKCTNVQGYILDFRDVLLVDTIISKFCRQQSGDPNRGNGKGLDRMPETSLALSSGARSKVIRSCWFLWLYVCL